MTTQPSASFVSISNTDVTKGLPGLGVIWYITLVVSSLRISIWGVSLFLHWVDVASKVCTCTMGGVKVRYVQFWCQHEKVCHRAQPGPCRPPDGIKFITQIHLLHMSDPPGYTLMPLLLLLLKSWRNNWMLYTQSEYSAVAEEWGEIKQHTTNYIPLLLSFQLQCKFYSISLS